MSANTSDKVFLEHLLTQTSDGLFVIGRDRKIVLFNPACERITGYSAAEVYATDLSCDEVNRCQDEHDRSLAGALCPARNIFREGQTTARQRMRITTKEGDHRWVETVYTRIGNDDSTPEAIIGVMRDITEFKEKEDNWRRTTENLRHEVEVLRRDMREKYGFAGIVSRSPRMQEVLDKIRAACSNSSPVLVCGERGTGKELVARTIHFNGLQKDRGFIPLNCTDVSAEDIEGELFGYVEGYRAGVERDYPGLFVAADGGTLYLEGIDRLSQELQGKLLRSMQDRCVRPLGSTDQQAAYPRIIAAVDQSAGEVVRSQRLREDLYARLRVITIELPALRERKEDIPFLVEHFIVQLNQQSTRQIEEIEPAVWVKLEAHDWPGNVSELQSVIESAFASGSGSTLRAEEIHLSRLAESAERSHPGQIASLDDVLADVERRSILEALRQTGGQRSLSAKLLNISRSRLYRRMDVLGITPKELNEIGK